MPFGTHARDGRLRQAAVEYAAKSATSALSGAGSRAHVGVCVMDSMLVPCIRQFLSGNVLCDCRRYLRSLRSSHVPQAQVLNPVTRDARFTFSAPGGKRRPCKVRINPVGVLNLPPISSKSRRENSERQVPVCHFMRRARQVK